MRILNMNWWTFEKNMLEIEEALMNFGLERLRLKPRHSTCLQLDQSLRQSDSVEPGNEIIRVQEVFLVLFNYNL